MKRLLFILFIALCNFCFAKSYSSTDYQGVPLDAKLIYLFKHLKSGTFIEAGAHDGISQSNTKLLEEKYHWRGICIEPSPTLYSSLKINRPGSYCYSCALGSFQENNTYIPGDFDGHLMSSIQGKRLDRMANILTPVRSLQSILDVLNITHIDLLSLDTEGHEYQILQGIDFDKTTFEYLLIEVYNSDYDKICTLLKNNGYDLIQNFSGYNFASNPGWDGTHNDYLFKHRFKP